MRLILIRHGETAWNASQRYQGQTDIPLNESGREQARRLADYLAKNEALQAVYCSDLSRAIETAQILAREADIEPIPDKRLREFCFGLWEGLTFNEIWESYREDFENWFNNFEEFCVPEGESFSDLSARSLEAIEEIKAKHSDTVAVVTHGGVIKAVLCNLKHSPDPWRDTVPPGSITIVDFFPEHTEIRCVGLTVQ